MDKIRGCDYEELVKRRSFKNLSPSMAKKIDIEILWRYVVLIEDIRRRKVLSREERAALRESTCLILAQIKMLGRK